MYSIGLDDFMGWEGITIVEWSERLTDRFDDATVIEIEDAGNDQRMLHVFSPKQLEKRGRSPF